MGLFVLTSPQASWAAGNAPAPLPSYEVNLTAYNAVEAQTDSNPLITASGAYSNPDIIAARSTDLADELPFGTVIAIEPSAATSSPGCGYDVVKDEIGLRVVGDSMNPRIHNTVDVLLEHSKSARTLGVCKDVTVVVVGHINMNKLSKLPKTQEQLQAMLDNGALAIAK